MEKQIKFYEYVLIGRAELLSLKPKVLLAAVPALRAGLVTRCPIVMFGANRKLKSVESLPSEIFDSSNDLVLCLSVREDYGNGRPALIKIGIAVQRAGNDKTYGKAVRDIVGNDECMGWIAKQHAGSRKFSTPSYLRSLFGETSMSADTAARAVRRSQPHYFNMDRLIRRWNQDLSTSFGASPYVFGITLVRRLKQDGKKDDLIDKSLIRVIQHIDQKSEEGLKRISAFVSGDESAVK